MYVILNIMIFAADDTDDVTGGITVESAYITYIT
jgi:hypothetical protein